MTPWLGGDNRVQRFYRPHIKVISRRHAPRGFAWEEDLYRLQIPDAKNPVEVEEKMGRIEDAGLRVRDKILQTSIDGLTPKEKAEFALFLALLLVRRPEYVKPKIDPAQEDWERRMLEAFEKPIEMGKLDKNSLLEMCEGIGSGLVFQGMLDSAKTWAAKIILLTWRSFDLRSGNLPVVLADYPFKMWGGENGELAKVTIPLAPYCIFVAGEAQSWTEICYREEFRQALAIDFIGDQFRSANKFVVALDNGKNDVYLKLANDNWGHDAPKSLS